MKKYFIVFLITASMFLSAFYITGKINDARVKNLNNVQERLSLNILSTETRFALLKEASCESLREGSHFEIGITQELNSLAKKIKFFESELDPQSEVLALLKERYALLQIKDYLLVQELSKKCNYNIATILYFYNSHCSDCRKQSLVLDALREAYPYVRVYWLDASLHTLVMNTVKEMFSVKKYPSMLIGQKLYTGFVAYDDLAKIIELWTRKHHALKGAVDAENIAAGKDFILSEEKNLFGEKLNDKKRNELRKDIDFVSFQDGVYRYRFQDEKGKEHLIVIEQDDEGNFHELETKK